MKRKSRTIDIWKQMTPAALSKFAFAVFLMFAAFGPTMLLMESQLHVYSWRFVLVQAFGTGALPACIILFGRRRWWVITLLVVFWTTILMLNSGGLSIVSTGRGDLRTELTGASIGVVDSVKQINHPITLQPAELNAIYTQRTIIGLMIIGFLVLGYVLFVRVIRNEIDVRSRFETEVKIAGEIQQSLQPSGTLIRDWCEIAGVTLPATEVGGDYFDIVELTPDKIAVCIADVTGHGVGAGILAAMTKSAFRLQLTHDPSPEVLLSHLNETLVQVSSDKMFVTFAYALLDRSTRLLHFATAGHPPVLLTENSSDTIHEIRTPSLALGMKQHSKFSECALPLSSQTNILFYTDGLVEAKNQKGEEFGGERVKSSFHQLSSHPKEINHTLITNLHRFTGDKILEDDVSLVSVTLS